MEEGKCYEIIAGFIAHSKWWVIALDYQKVLIKSCIIRVVKKAVAITKIAAKTAKVTRRTIIKPKSHFE